MTKRISDQLADLSVRAKGAEEALDAADSAGDKLVLAGATRDALKASPPFEYVN